MVGGIYDALTRLFRICRLLSLHILVTLLTRHHS
jgi:hypothetical protein